MLFTMLACTVMLAEDGLGNWCDGTWAGEIKIQEIKLPLNFNFVTMHNGNVEGTIDSPQQGAFGIACTSVKVNGDSIEVIMDALNAKYSGIHRGDSIEGQFRQGFTLPLTLRRSEKAVKKERAQTPVPPFPYDVTEVKIENKADNVTLAGTLTTPKEGKKLPAVVLITGSGAQNRDEEMFEHRPFAVIADHLTRNGIAVLRYDDRGTAGSTGDFATATTMDFARDARAAFEFLTTQPRIDKKKISYMGHSEGGQIAIINASEQKDVASIVTLAAPSVKGSLVLERQNEAIILASGAKVVPAELTEMYDQIFKTIETEENTDSLTAKLTSIMTQGKGLESMAPEMQVNVKKSVAAMTTPWYISFVKFDPAANLRALKCPVFALNGSLDLQVDPTINLTAIRVLSGSKNTVTKCYEGLNHMFQHCEPGIMGMQYGSIEETISTEVLDDIVKWLKP